MAIQPFATQIQAPQIESPYTVQSNVLALRQQQQANALRQKEMQQLQQQEARRNELLDIYRGGGDIQNRLMQGGFVPEAQQFGKMRREDEDAQIKRTYDQLDMARQILTSAVDEPSYQRAMAQAKQLGLPTQDAPAAFDPNWVQGQIQMATPILERLRLAQQERTAGIQEAQVELRERELGARGAGQPPKPGASGAAIVPVPKPMTAREEMTLRKDMGKSYGSVNQTTSLMNDVKKAVAAVRDAPGKEGATGLSSYVPSYPGGEASKADQAINNLKGKLTALGRSTAALSGAIGPMAVQEWKIVADQIAALDPAKMDPSMLEDQLKIIEDAADTATTNIRDEYETTYGDYFEKFPKFEVKETKVPVPGGPKTRAPKSGVTRSGVKYTVED